jgi:hypothetical protein
MLQAKKGQGDFGANAPEVRISLAAKVIAKFNHLAKRLAVY